MDADETQRRMPVWTPLLLFVAALAAHASYVRDIPFICDEPAFLALAFTANQGGHLATQGLTGSFGVTYSPVPVWIYQLFLGLTLDIARVATIKILVVSAALAFAMWRLCETTKLSPWPLLLIPVSPFLAFYQRQLWDNVFLIPVTAGMMAATASILVRPKVSSLCLLAGLSALAFHIHVMAVVPIVACAITVLLFGRAWIAQHWKAVSLCGALAIAAASPLFYAMVFQRGQDVHPHPGLLDALLAPLQGFLYWSHLGFDAFMASFYDDSRILYALQIGTSVLLALAGVAALVAVGVQAFRRSSPLAAWPVRDQIAVLSAAIVLGQTALLFGLRLDPRWHYFNGVCLGYFYLIWWGFDRVRQRIWAKGLLAAEWLATAGMTVLLAIHVHAHHGDRSDRYGATLGNQMQVAQMLVGHAVSGVSLNVDNYAKYPQALELLVYTRAAETRTPLKRTGGTRATVRYADADGDDGRIEVVFANP